MTLTSTPTSKCALKCKYCGIETPFLFANENTQGEWEVAGEEYELRNFLREHSFCALKEIPQRDNQPFLLSWG